MKLTHTLPFLFMLSLFLLQFSSIGSANSTETSILPPSNIEMILVKAGTFKMGNDNSFSNESPVHKVTITRDYYMSKYEVTYEMYDQYTSATKSRKAHPNIKNRGLRPVEGVNWFDAISFCNWLSKRDGLTPAYNIMGNLTTCDFNATGYRIPTEAEWEYAARGGQKSKGYIHSGSNNPDEVAWYDGNANGDYKPVGLKKPNELGIHDMNGNMWEWCWDWYDPKYYSNSPKLDPKGPKTIPDNQISPHDPERSRRSGRWLNIADNIKVSSRSADFSRYEGDNGIRLVRNR